MRHQTTLRRLLALIGFLALLATSVGLWWPIPGDSTTFSSHRGEVVTLHGHGLYRYDTISMAAQEQAGDLVTLVLALPLLLVSAFLAFMAHCAGSFCW